MRWLHFESDLSKPIAVITAAVPTIIVQGNTQYFSGYGIDVDGVIVAYRWTSNIDGVISTSASFTTNALSSGNHVISFEVQDNDGQWSSPDTVSVEVNAVVSPDTLRVSVNRMGIGVVAQDHPESVGINRLGIGVLAQDHPESVQINHIGTGAICQDHPESVSVNRLGVGVVTQDFASGSVDVNRMGIGVIAHEMAPWDNDVEVADARVDACVQVGYYGSDAGNTDNSVDRDVEVADVRIDACVMVGDYGSDSSNVNNSVDRDVEVADLRVDVIVMVNEP